MGVIIERISESTAELVCGSTTPANCPPFGFGNVAGGLIFCIASSASPITVNFYAQFSGSDTPMLLCDGSNAAVSQQIQANRCYELPTALYGAAAVRVVPTAGTCTIRFIGKA